MYDVVFINPGNAKGIYQDLANDYSAIEPPTWSLLLAESMRSVGFKVKIFDINAERLNTKEAVSKLGDLKSKLFCFVVYGQNPNSGTVNMSGATYISNELKKVGNKTTTCFVGSHISALPYEVLINEKSIDIILCNEGVYSLRNLLKLNTDELKDLNKLENIKGIGFRKDNKPFLTMPEKIVPQEKMDIDLPGYAWDLLPYNEKPLDLYRAHFWHAEYDHNKRSPFAAIYTSLGCMFKCEFCMINILNREDNDPIGNAQNYSKMRFWSPEFIIKEFDKLVGMGVSRIRISDEMFLLNKKYYKQLCNLIIERGYGEKLSMWAYSRIDTIKDAEQLKLLKKSGIKWLGIGIESGDKNIRLEVTKGKFENVNIRDVIKLAHENGIEVIANYLFGLPKDNLDTMKKTLDLSLELCTVAWNAYAVMALPGSAMYKQAIENNHQLPTTYEGFSFHSYDTLPLPTEFLKPHEILKFRDEAFHKYHTHKPFLEKVKKRYGQIAVDNILEQTKIKLKRRIVEENENKIH